jgi:hypothetical protein
LTYQARKDVNRAASRKADDNSHRARRIGSETEKLEIIEHEWAKARAKNPEVVMRVNVQDETDESGKPRVNVVIAFSGTWASIKKSPRKNSSNSKAL